MNSLSRRLNNILSDDYYGLRRMESTLDDFSSMFDHLSKSLGVSGLPSIGRAFFAPAMDVEAFDDRAEVTLEIPGMKKEDIDISVDDGVLKISGKKEKATKTEDEEKINYIEERYYGSFEREISVSNLLNTDEISASYSEGVLKIVIPKLENEENKTIKKIDVK